MKLLRTTALVVAAVAVLGLLASPAGATEETVGSCLVEKLEEVEGGVEGFETIVHDGHADGASEEASDALHEVEEDLEKCLEAPNPILPETNEIIWGGLAFFVLLGAMIRWGFPLVRDAMQDRTDKIRTDLEEAERARAEAVELKQQHEAELARSKADANRVIDEARQEAAGVKATLQARAEADIAEMRQRAQVDVEAAQSRAMTDLQGEVAEVVVGAAERVVGHNLDVNTQRQLIDDYIASVGRNGS